MVFLIWILLSGWSFSLWWNCLCVGPEEVKYCGGSSLYLNKLQGSRDLCFQECLSLALWWSWLQAKAVANLEEAAFPKCWIFSSCTMNHKSPNISIEYCLPTCLVGFHFTKSWQPNERSALIGRSSPLLRRSTNEKTTLSGVCKSCRQAPRNKKVKLNGCSCY